jgi:DNA-binding transcriptional regulator YiaG
MSNHPNRNKDRANSAASNPTPDMILARRNGLGLTQQAAGKVVYSSLRRWQAWELGESRMHPAIWELFLLKTGE